MNRRRFLMIAAATTIPGRASADVATWQAVALGGTVRVDLRGPRRLADSVANAIGAAIEEVEAAVSLFRADSALCRLNAAGRLDDPPPALTDLMRVSDTIHHATDGLFDPTVQPLWQARADGRTGEPERRHIGWERVRTGPPILLQPGQALTFNGIAQGYAAARVKRLLLDAGYEHALVDMGEFAALGGPFALSVEDPVLGPIATRRLTGNAIATSSPSAMRIGSAYHILGPHGERPLWSTVSVEAEGAALADGLSTAFCLMDAEAIRTTIRSVAGVGRVTLVSLSGDVSTL